MSSKKPEILIEVLKIEEIPELAKMLFTIWNGDFERILAKTNWAFNNKDSIVFIAKDKSTGKIIGSRGAIKWHLQYDNSVLDTYQFHGTSVHPDYQRMGIFTKLNKHFLEYAEKSNIYGVFNVSVEASKNGYEKLGWSYLPGFERIFKVVNPLNLAFKFLGGLTSKKNEEVDVLQLSEEFPLDDDSLKTLLEIRNEKYKRKNRPYVLYDENRFKERISNISAGYKYCVKDESFAIYKIVNIKSIYKGILIGDVLLKNHNYISFKKVISEIIKNEKPDFLITYISNEHPLYEFFKKNKFFSTRKKFMNFGTKIINSKDQDFFGESVWQISIFDIDTF